MKKNISINISGIIFHIEEDGYEALKQYLESINRYFTAFEDSSEILADIESRIAEIFLSKLYEGKQVITSEDVNSLIATMGSVRDFKAAEEQEPADQARTESKSDSTYSKSAYTPPLEKRFMRDQKRKVLGGICAGLGSYFNIDPVWIRLLFALLTLAYGIILIVYVILWIVIPGSYELEEPQISKKLFRNPDKKVLGGVASGLSAYLGMDVVVVRLLFVIAAFFGGIGFFVYIVMWIVFPEARSITEKMQMQGEPVTLSNIESSVKKGLDIKENEEESALVKILLFPFRALGWLLTNLGKILTPLLEVIRVGFGILISMVGLSMVVSVVILGGILIGFLTFSSGWAFGWQDVSLPIEAMSRAVPGFIMFLGFIGSLVPGIIIVLLGVSIIAKRIVFGAAAGWSLFILFFLSMAFLTISIPKIIMSFKEDGEFKTETTYEIAGKTAVFKLREVGLDDYDAASLTLKGYEGNSIKVVQLYTAKGGTKMKAIENAQMVGYSIAHNDSLLTFDSNIYFKDDAIFRGQRLNMIVYVPFNQPFIMDDNFWQLMNQYIEYDFRNGNTWKINETGNLECITCPEQLRETPLWEEDEAEEMPYGNLSDFNELEISGIFDLTVKKGSRYSVELIGPASEKAKYRVVRMGNTLVIDYNDEKKLRWNKNPLKFDEIQIYVTLPSIKKAELKGAGKASFSGFDEDKLQLKLLGAINGKSNLNIRDLSLYLSGASELKLTGEGDTMDAKILGASSLSAYEYRVNDALVEANGASKASVQVTGRLEIEEGLASKVSYRGNPAEVIKD